MAGQFTAGKRVRLKTDPSKMGILTGKTRERAGKIKWQVGFPEGDSYQQEYELELIANDSNDPYELLEQGKFGRVSDLRRNLTQINLSGKLANLVYSMDVSNIQFFAYQYKPVLSFLESPSNGILIADEVGLGKTIEAGLIWTELRSRMDARRLLVLCPAMLREKWRDELRERFAVEADILGPGELLRELKRSRYDVPDGKAFICSQQGLRPGRKWDDEKVNKSDSAQLARFLSDNADDEPLFDLVIVDEAHYLRNPESQTARLGELLRKTTAHIVLLSATPVNLHSDDLFNLLKLVDPSSFEYNYQFPSVLRANEPLNQAKLLALDTRQQWQDVRGLLLEAKKHSLLSNSRQLQSLLDYQPDNDFDKAERIEIANRIEKVNLLRHAVTRTRKSEVNEWQVIRDPKTYFIKLSESEREFYDAVTAEIRRYAYDNDLSDGFLLASPQRQISSSMYAAARAWRGKFSQEELEQLNYENFGDFIPEDNQASVISSLVNRVLPRINTNDLKENDSKYNEFSTIVKQYLQQNKNEKLVVFSFFRETIRYLAERLTSEGVECQILIGGMKESKHDIIANFRESKTTSVLLSSEVASEGVDLQFCKLLINYDIPWNPMKIEQRIGRIDRLGQTSPKIKVWNLCYDNTIDQRIHRRLLERLDIFRRALGGLEAIIGEKIAELTRELFLHQLTPEEEEQRIDRSALAIERLNLENRELEKNASSLIAHSDYILEHVKAAYEFKKRVTKEDLVIYVQDYLRKFAQGHTFQQENEEELIFKIRLPTNICEMLGSYCKRKNILGKTMLATGDTYICQFVNKFHKQVKNKEFVNQFHPLIRFISEDLASRREAFYPLIASTLYNADYNDSNFPPGKYAFLIKKWEASGIRTEEILHASMISIELSTLLDAEDAMRIINAARLSGKDWREVNNETDVDALSDLFDQCEEVIDSHFVEFKENYINENQDRVDLQIKSLDTNFARSLNTLEDTLRNLIAQNKTRVIPATRGRISKLKERYEMQREKLNSKKTPAHSHAEVCRGVIKIC